MILLSCIILLYSNWLSSGQDTANSSRILRRIPWSGTGQVCNVCHEPFNAKYSIRQTPYWNHQVGSTTFRGNKLDGSPVLIKAINSDDKCLSCHKNNKSGYYNQGKLSKNEFEVWHP